ncbi:MAG: bifunctional diaminohydroxyphosphoribosylaminopyrimidine deaminase/5-amino-6-(5-phosphoribosylamino)uracil reductase RibD, partial [Myxococcales bacterium]|nr:bifunctional diaminohydroxyphosphoribosylaminopyrimidine deaminase/5-amino-6-(5-phosphoribosylamino)uracil reductase RibD [Myxococcales bacterium]
MPDAHAGHMARALALIETAPHRTSPNPTVGCVIVRDGVVVGEGVTRPAGQAHAELVALEAAGERARGAVMYVTLEPCAHFGRTPPCTEAIIAAGVARVFVGTIDPNPLVHGAGLRQLAAAGIHAEVGLLGEACDRVLNPFRRFIRDKRPWVLLKAATTLDGQLAAASGDSKWITGEAARRDAHRLRARVDAVLVGAATARVDDPRLTVRLVEGADPLRVVLDAQATLSPTAALLGPGALVLHAPDAPAERVAALAATGADALT